MKSDIKSIKRIIVQIYSVLLPYQRRKSLVVFLSMILTSLLELLGVSMVLPLLGMMMNREDTEKTWYVKWVYKVFPNITFEYVILLFSLGIIAVFIIKNLAALFFMYIQQKFAAYFMCDTSSLILSAIMKRPYVFFLDHNSADLIQGVEGDVASVYNEILAVFQLIGELLTCFFIGLYLFVVSLEIAIFSMAIAFCCFIFVVVGFKGVTKKAGKKYREAYVNRTKYALQAFNGIKEISVSDRRESFVKQYYSAAEDVAKTTMIYGFVGSCPDRIIEGVCITGFIGIVCVRIMMGVEIETFVPILGAFAMGAFKILPSISKISSRVTSIIYYQPGLQNCYDNIIEIRSREEDINGLSVLPSEYRNDVIFDKELRVNGVSWKYENSSGKVLDELSLTINKGESVAFIGASGAGKTTLADIILGLFRPKEGSVEMDGIDIYSIRHEWSRIIGYVPQSVYLVDDTIRANVAFGIEPGEVDDDKIWDALDQAQLKGFVENLPDGIDTIVGERGIKFSGGQRQRVAIARALYDNPDILVLDEATSALDIETETAVMQSIEALQGHKTLIIVAHRLSTIRKCDRIFEIVDGKAVERKHEEVFEDT